MVIIISCSDFLFILIKYYYRYYTLFHGIAPLDKCNSYSNPFWLVSYSVTLLQVKWVLKRTLYFYSDKLNPSGIFIIISYFVWKSISRALFWTFSFLFLTNTFLFRCPDFRSEDFWSCRRIQFLLDFFSFMMASHFFIFTISLFGTSPLKICCKYENVCLDSS